MRVPLKTIPLIHCERPKRDGMKLAKLPSKLPPNRVPSVERRRNEMEDVCTWFVRDPDAATSGAGSVRPPGLGTAWQRTGLARTARANGI